MKLDGAGRKLLGWVAAVALAALLLVGSAGGGAALAFLALTAAVCIAYVVVRDHRELKGILAESGRRARAAQVAMSAINEPAPVARPAPPTSFNRIVSALDEFQCVHAYPQELGYHAELAGWLRARFPELRVEVQRGHSRPDIVIGDVAIEVKGPTDVRELETVADKCSRYSLHFSRLIVVLFDVRVPKGRYEEWRNGIARTYPSVQIVRFERPNGPRIETHIVCARCQAADTVPFEPKHGQELLCRSCYRGSRGFRPHPGRARA